MLIALSLRRATMAIVLLATFGIFLTSCNKEELDQELAPLANDDAPKTLADYPDEITIENWREFVTAPKEVLAHFDALDRAQQAPQRITKSEELEAAMNNRSSTVFVGQVQGYNGSWGSMAGVTTEVGANSTTSTSAAPYNYFNIEDGVNPLCMSYGTGVLNGVTTFDLVVIQQHILGISCFTTAREYLAADATRDGKIDSYDIDEIQDMILFINTAWTTSDNVVFVPEDDYQYLEGQLSACTAPTNLVKSAGLSNNCLATIQPSYYRFRRAIKTGDLNGSFSF